MHAVYRIWLYECHRGKATGSEVRFKRAEITHVGAWSSGHEELERVLLRHIIAALPQLLVIPRPTQTFGGELIPYMLKSVRPGRSLWAGARAIERIQGVGVVIIRRGN